MVNVNSSCAGVANANVEIWHVDAAGNYSQYGSQSGQTYLRGIQTTNSSGEATFTTIYPGWYAGRATHIHLEVTINGASVKVTQIAFPESVNATVHTSWRVRFPGHEPDVERRRRDFRRQSGFGVGDTNREPPHRLCGNFSGRYRRLSAGG